MHFNIVHMTEKSVKKATVCNFVGRWTHLTATVFGTADGFDR